ncbi:unnamed protein product [Zymoseptoria tritici ST99CH_1E4]|uniref:Uncharacterized protein n=1 Tax=Zymoseptoria tritici ST99CH_1E4 TaxID=1276532 RepID=A0A2H1GEX3_ZYMTR|nr:unnamed protein product [Zymoseptoria tritici ST99CH_1E4]
MADDIAIVGYACRLPGHVSTPDDLWELCTRGRNGWSEIPEERFSSGAFHHPNPLKPGTFNPKGGFFLKDDISKFDAPFFNLTKKEAISLDPQQRLLLECTYEALENAGFPRESYAGRKVGVYVGGNFADYELMNVRDLETAPVFQATGCAPAMQANRISHFFDFRGPSMTIDTACSGSLVALHHAVQSLARGETSEGIVAGCRLNILPDYFVTMSMSQLLNDHGKTFAFDDRADGGFAKGEGAGVLVLKPLKDAIRDKDSIRAVITKTGVNQDGKTIGITNPNGDAQQSLVQQMYSDANIDPAECAFAECHGTGTKVGDPIEARAIHQSLSHLRSPEDPLYIGSVKSNVGHLEGASGVISMIKASLMLEKELLLPNANFRVANPAIPMDDWNMKVLKSTRPWPKGKHYVDVSNYGFGGTNAHAILQMAPRETRRPPQADNSQPADPTVKLFLTSANDQEALKKRMNDLTVYIEQRPEVFEKSLCPNVAYTLGARRSHLRYRLAVPATCLAELSNSMTTNSIRLTRSLDAPKLGFVFTGQGAQWPQMGMGLMREYPIFASAINRADAHLRSLGADFSLSAELLLPKKMSHINNPEISQPACTAVQIGLVELFRSWGVQPSSVVGHSSGEIAAAYTAGAFDADTAMGLAYFRGLMTLKLKAAYPDLEGGMIAIGLGPDGVAPYLEKISKGYATIACINSPTSVTVSGDRTAIAELHEILQAENIFNRQLPIDVAYHSNHMAKIADLYLVSISAARPSTTLTCSFVSSVYGRHLEGSQIEPQYWVDNLISPVRFADAVALMCSDSERPDMLIEFGPHSALKGPILDSMKAQGLTPEDISYSACLIRNEDALTSVLTAAGAVYMRGVTLDTLAINFPHSQAQSCALLTDLPRYPWQHSTSYWHSSRLAQKHIARSGERNDVLGALAAYSNDLEPTWRNIIRLDDIPWLRHHKMQGLPVFPFAGYIAMAIEAAKQESQFQKLEFDGFELHEIVVSAAMVLDDASDTEATITLRPHNEASRGYSKTWKEFRICSWGEGPGWTENCRGLVRATNSRAREHQAFASCQQLEAKVLGSREEIITARATQEVCQKLIYEDLDRVGAGYGTSFQGLRNCFSGAEHSRGDIFVQDTKNLMPKAFEPELVIHPSLLDIFLHLTWPILGAGQGSFENLYMPTSVQSVKIQMDSVKQTGEHLQVWCSGTPDLAAPKPTTFDMHATKPGEQGRPVIEFKGFVMTPLGNADSTSAPIEKICYKMVAEPFEPYGRKDSPFEDARRDSPLDAPTGFTLLNGTNGTNGHATTNGNGTNGHALTNGNGTNGDHHHVNGTNGHLTQLNGTNGVNGAAVNGDHAAETSEITVVHFGNCDKLSSDVSESIHYNSGLEAPIDALGSVDCSGKRVVLLQASGTSLADVSSADFDSLKQVLLTGAQVIWVYAKDEPETGMSVGLARTIRAENMSKIYTLGVDSSELQGSWSVMAIEQAMQCLWFSPPEEAVRDAEFTASRGHLSILRIVDDDQLNDFMRSQTGTAVFQKQDFAQPDRRLRMKIESAGALDTLYWEDEPVEVLQDDAIEIEVRATGVNFKDIVVSMGQVSQPYIGVECSGVVASIGKNVTNVQVGQRVMAMTTGAYSTYARCLATSAFPIADSVSFEEAATIPVIFATAYYALFDCARLEEGETILIHAAAGGVGQAAIMLAKTIGAKILATVGSADKKQFLMEQYSIPEENIFYSRDASFGPMVRHATGQAGVNVVLNSLAGELLRESWDCLAPFGRFIEIGKADITQNGRLDMLKFEYNCTFSSVDLTKVAAYKPKLMQRLLSDVHKLIASGTISPISPVKTFPISETEAAFRALQSGRIFGKLVVVPREGDQVRATTRKVGDSLLRSDATYVIIGGTGGLGRSMARWMSMKGARNIVLTSRSASMNDRVQALADDLSPHGTKLVVKACDVSDMVSVKQLVEQDLNGLPQIRGIVHGAMVLEDMLYEQMSIDSFRKVTACKVQGAQNLHQVLAGQELDFFVALSSVAGVVGNRGQAAYAAANVFLDSFMEWRRSQGLPGASIDLAAISNVGYLADGSDARREEVLKNIGGQTLDESQVLALLAAAVTGKLQSCGGQCITGLGNATKESFWISDSKFAILKEIVDSQDGGAGADAANVPLLKLIRTASTPEEASTALYEALAIKIANVLVLPEDAIKPSQTLKALGLDSLVAIEIRNYIARETEVNLQVLELLSSGSILNLVHLILKKMGIEV